MFPASEFCIYPLQIELKVASSFVMGRNNFLPFTLQIPDIFNHIGVAKVIFASNEARMADAKKRLTAAKD